MTLSSAAFSAMFAGNVQVMAVEAVSSTDTLKVLSRNTLIPYRSVQGTIQLFNGFKHEADLDPFISKQMQKFFEFKFNSMKFFFDLRSLGYLDEFPQWLRNSTFFAVCGKLIMSTNFLLGKSPEIVVKLLSQMKLQYLDRDDTLYYKDQHIEQGSSAVSTYLTPI
jgi:hypothetical protein